MEFKFKIQPYQTAAADAVCDAFEGQPSQAPLAYLRDLGRVGSAGSGERALFPFSDEGEGYANAPVALTPSELLRNVNRVQRANQIAESRELFDGMGACQLDVEMETGTGKTYVYTKTAATAGRSSSWWCPRWPSARACASR